MDKKDLIREWLKKSEHDIGTAKVTFENIPEYSDTICFHCQQAVEKVLKAYCLNLGIHIIQTHDLAFLLDKISEKEKVDENIYQICEIINDYSVEVRYPGDFAEPEKHEVEEAINIAEKAIKYFKMKLENE